MRSLTLRNTMLGIKTSLCVNPSHTLSIHQDLSNYYKKNEFVQLFPLHISIEQRIDVISCTKDGLAWEVIKAPGQRAK